MPHCVMPQWLTMPVQAAGSILPLLCWSEDHLCTACSFVSQPPMYFLDFPVLLQQETCLMGASERNSWKLNAMCPHEFLRGLSSYCAPNVCDRNINRSADVLSWVLKLPASRVSSPVMPYEEQHTVTPGHLQTFSYSGSSGSESEISQCHRIGLGDCVCSVICSVTQ